MENLKPTKETQFIKSENTALVVIDLQNVLANRDLAPFTFKQVVLNSERLINAFKKNGAFVVLVKVSSLDGKDMLKPDKDSKASRVKSQKIKGWDEFVPELANKENVHSITKKQWGAFYGTDLDLQLRRRGINTIVLCGVSTSIGVDTTAREAYQRGYNQIFSIDAMAASTKEEHDYVCKYIFPKIGKIRTTEGIVLSLK